MKNNSSNIYKAREVFKKKLPFLLMRNKIIASIKIFFQKENFTEVDTPILQYCPGMEVHLRAFETKFVNITGEPSKTLYLHTSPEFAMKKLLSFSLENIFQFTHTFRNEIISPTHYPEFTMLEWYRLNHNYTKLMSDCEEILKEALLSIGKTEFTYNGKTCTPFNGIEKLTIQEAFQKFGHFDILSTINNPENPSKDLLEAEAKKLHINVSKIDTWDDIYEKLMFEYIEPNLGIDRPTILYEYPIHQAALSKAKPENPNIAERFELYICGVEVANAFTELTDPETQLSRFKKDMQTKKDLYGISYPIDNEFIEALNYIPSATGIAMGIDRLIILSTGAKDITEVLWTTIPTL